MDTMKGFYTSITSASRLQGPYLEALSGITMINRGQTKTLMSYLGWQEWGRAESKSRERVVAV